MIIPPLPPSHWTIHFSVAQNYRLVPPKGLLSLAPAPAPHLAFAPNQVNMYTCHCCAGCGCGRWTVCSSSSSGYGTTSGTGGSG